MTYLLFSGIYRTVLESGCGGGPNVCVVVGEQQQQRRQQRRRCKWNTDAQQRLVSRGVASKAEQLLGFNSPIDSLPLYVSVPMCGLSLSFLVRLVVPVQISLV